MIVNVFELPDRLHAKADPALIESDQQHFATIAATLAEQQDDLSARLDDLRRAPVRMGEEALTRDQEVQRLSARLRLLRLFGLDLCLGRMVGCAGDVTYVGRVGLTDSAGGRLMIDWRSPAAEPFFGATHADPMGLASRRRYRWTGGRISDYWDEIFAGDAPPCHAALDDQSAFIASLGATRSPRMRDVLGTIAADQDAIIRAPSAGALVVDGGPGTGKTVIALHRAAYLLYADPRLRQGRGGVLVVGPHQPYLAYVADVLPSLGEDEVRLATVRELVPEGPAAGTEADREAARLKAGLDPVAVIEAAVGFYEAPPESSTSIDSPWGTVRLSPADWEEAFGAPDPTAPHNEAREDILETLVDILLDKLGPEVPPAQARKSLAQNGDLLRAVNSAWPLLTAEDVTGDLWTVPAYLRLCAPELTPQERTSLRRSADAPWTVSDLPFLDVARRRLGDPESARRRRRQQAELDGHQEEMSRVVEHLIATDDSELQVMSMLRGSDLRGALVDRSGVDGDDRDPLAGPFAHIVVDEAQELTDAEWRILLQRCPFRSFTVVGDRAQARHGFTESWQERLRRIGFDRIDMAGLSINYRTPVEVMAEAEPVIRAVLPDANVPVSIRSTGVPVTHGSTDELPAILRDWAVHHQEAIACVIGDPTLEDTPRVRSLTPELAKGLEFDLVVLVDPQRFGAGIEGAVDRYVAMSRATQRLVVLTSPRAGGVP